MQKFLKTSGWLATIAGILMVVVGIWGICFTYKNVTQENIVTPADASIPSAKVRGPFTLMSQADIIREHALEGAVGKTYAEMPRQIQKLDEAGSPVLDAEGNPVMTANEARNTWITATALITALHLGIVGYVFSGLVLLLGLISLWTGWVFCKLSRHMTPSALQ